jgi:FkbM family methyltransferase
MLSRLKAWLLRTYVRTPEHPTKYRIVRWLGRNLFPQDGIWCQVYPGFRWLLHPRDWIEYSLLRGGAYEPHTLDFLAANLSEGDAALLAGVNFGLHVAAAARAVGALGTVIGVEPQPRAMLRAAENLRANGLLDRVRLLNAALGSEEALAPMAWSAPENPGAASLLDQGAGFVTPLLRLSRVIEGLSPKRLRLLLLDVQGFESQALSGLDADQTPDILVVEVENEFLRRANMTSEGLLNQLEGMGYALHTVDGAEAAKDATEFPENNVIAVKPEARVVWKGTTAARVSSAKTHGFEDSLLKR